MHTTMQNFSKTFASFFSVLYAGVSMYVGDAVKAYGTHERRKRNVIGVTPWGLIENHSDLIGRDVSVQTVPP